MKNQRPNSDDIYWRSDEGAQEYEALLIDHYDKYFTPWEIDRNRKEYRTGILQFCEMIRLRGLKGRAGFGMLTFGLSKYLMYGGGATKYDAVRQEILVTYCSEKHLGTVRNSMEVIVSNIFDRKTWAEPFLPIELSEPIEEFVSIVPVTGLFLEEEDGYIESHFPTYIVELMLMKAKDLEGYQSLGEDYLENLDNYLELPMQ